MQTFPKGAKIDLSDRSRIDDQDCGKGRSTPKNVLLSARNEFFNRIRRLPTTNFDAIDRELAWRERGRTRPAGALQDRPDSGSASASASPTVIQASSRV